MKDRERRGLRDEEGCWWARRKEAGGREAVEEDEGVESGVLSSGAAAPHFQWPKIQVLDFSGMLGDSLTILAAGTCESLGLLLFHSIPAVWWVWMSSGKVILLSGGNSYWWGWSGKWCVILPPATFWDLLLISSPCLSQLWKSIFWSDGWQMAGTCNPHGGYACA